MAKLGEGVGQEMGRPTMGGSPFFRSFRTGRDKGGGVNKNAVFCRMSQVNGPLYNVCVSILQKLQHCRNLTTEARLRADMEESSILAHFEKSPPHFIMTPFCDF